MPDALSILKVRPDGPDMPRLLAGSADWATAGMHRRRHRPASVRLDCRSRRVCAGLTGIGGRFMNPALTIGPESWPRR